jgi:hypothetical protein
LKKLAYLYDHIVTFDKKYAKRNIFKIGGGQKIAVYRGGTSRVCAQQL